MRFSELYGGDLSKVGRAIGLPRERGEPDAVFRSRIRASVLAKIPMPPPVLVKDNNGKFVEHLGSDAYDGRMGIAEAKLDSMAANVLPNAYSAHDVTFTYSGPLPNLGGISDDVLEQLRNTYLVNEPPRNGFSLTICTDDPSRDEERNFA